jgi:hypothetical protein
MDAHAEREIAVWGEKNGAGNERSRNDNNNDVNASGIGYCSRKFSFKLRTLYGCLTSHDHLFRIECAGYSGRSDHILC